MNIVNNFITIPMADWAKAMRLWDRRSEFPKSEKQTA